jgi:DNA-binding CsgD family transcriptional regulator
MMTREIPWEPVLQVIGTVAEIDDPGRFGLEVLNALSSAIPFDIGSFNEIDLDSGRAVFVASPPEEEDADQETRAAFPRLVQQNPILQYQDRTGDGSAHRLSDFLSAEALHGLELYQRVYKPRGVEFQVAIGLATKRPLVVAFALNRQHTDFSDRELQVLDALRPHLVQAHRNVQALAALQGIDGALAGVGKAIVVLDPQGGVVHAPAWAWLALERHFGDTASGELPIQVANWIEQERENILDDGLPRLHKPLVSAIDEQQLVARYVPGVESRPDAFVLEEQSPKRGISELKRLHLTEREAELLWLLMKGKTTAEVAKDLAVAPSTANKHLQHIYRKLGVLNRTAAIAAASDAVFSRW